jgi:hypothetical protein
VVTNAVKRIARQSKSAIIAAKIVDNLRARRRFGRGNNESALGSTHCKLTLGESLSYIRRQFEDYLAYGRLSGKELEGKNVLDVGFGDNLGVALMFLAAGANSAVCVDKFLSKANPSQQKKIYEALRESLTNDERENFDEAIDLSDGLQLNPERLLSVHGVAAERLRETLGGSRFDVIVSRAVLQDIPQPAAAFDAMSAVLKPGGLMLHKIDLSDQGMFRDCGMHPLTFLTVPEGLYQLMSSDSGNSNRKLAGYYRRELGRLGYDTTVFYTSLIGHGSKGDLLEQCQAIDLQSSEARLSLDLVRKIRPRLAGGFRELADEELMVDGIFLVARKPEASKREEAGKVRLFRPGEQAAPVSISRAASPAGERAGGSRECA